MKGLQNLHFGRTFKVYEAQVLQEVARSRNLCTYLESCSSCYILSLFLVALFPVMMPGNLQWITWEPMVRFGWKFACANICTTVSEKKPGIGRASKNLGNLTVAWCRYWHMQNISQIGQPCYFLGQTTEKWAKTQGGTVVFIWYWNMQRSQIVQIFAPPIC